MNRFALVMVFLSIFCQNVFGQTKETPQWRPAYHFTPPKNWTNDPNGLMFINGEFHLYYQHNPFENKWGHMSWGHATSKDLVHWNNLAVAIPEIISNDTITMIYSGSAVLDKNNTSGLGSNDKAPLIAIFTADQPKQKKESQFIAYSNNNGASYQLFKNNPVIDLDKRDFRDPNVFWHEATKQWIMTVSMVTEHMIRIYGSKNLKEWTKLSDFGPAGYTKHGWECPSLMPIAVDGDKSKIKWVLFVSSGGDRGSFMQYFVGDFDGITFKNDNPADKVFTVDDGDTFYAAIPWRLADKQILLGWLVPGKPETFPWRGQMSIPRDLSLRTTSDGIRLIQLPAATIKSNLSKLAAAANIIKNKTLGKQDLPLLKTGNTNAYWIDVDFSLGDAKQAGFKIAQNKALSKQIIVGYDVAAKELFVDCTAAEKENKAEKNLVQRVPLKTDGGHLKLQVLVDRSSLEVFANDGEKVISTMIYPDVEATGAAVFGSSSKINSLQLWNMNK